MAALGTEVSASAWDITLEIAVNDSVDSLPPLSIAAFPDFIASEVMFAMTSGRASNIMSSTPIGHVTRWSSSPSSNSVRRVVRPTSIEISIPPKDFGGCKSSQISPTRVLQSSNI